MAEPGSRELVLVGGGHAHVQVLRRFMMEPAPGVHLSLVLDRAEAVYSGMVPGFVAGQYRADELEIDCVPLARRARARVVLSAATRVDPEARRIELAGRPAISYDVASLDVGSSVRGLDLPGVREHAVATRPIRDFVDRLDERLAACARRSARLVIVGGGAAGCELALTLEARLRGRGLAPGVTLVADSPEILPGASPRLVRRVRAELAQRGVRVLCESRVARVEKDAAVLEHDEEPLPADLVVWATGAAPPALLAASPLPLCERGFVRVDSSLRVVGHPTLFAAGDCAALDAHPWVPKAGVYGVRQGPPLERNLRAALSGRRLRAYRPQRDFLSLLNTGEGSAIGAKWGLVASGAGVFRLKDWIDRRFVRRFRVLEPDGAPAPDFPTPESMGMEEMPCGGCAAKLGAVSLERALAGLPEAPADPDVLVGLAHPDDAAALRMPGGDTVLATVDGFRAFTDDPWLVGRVAAVNAVSDVLAKGGRPRHALAQVGLPEAEPERSEETLGQVLAGVRAALDPLGVSLVGGHTTVGDELFVGLTVLGVSEAPPIPLSGARTGDHLVLTRPLGSGVLLAADMQGRAPGAWVQALHATLLRPNVEAAATAREHGARAATDVSGFGLARHLCDLLEASGVGARLWPARVPAYAGARELLARGVRSTFHAQNAAAAVGRVRGAASAADVELLFDPQTAGGLLFAVAPGASGACLAALHAAGEVSACVVAEARPGAAGSIELAAP